MAENELEQTDQNWTRFKDPVMAIAAGAGAALVVVTLPHVYLENIVGTTGLSEIVPAAAPPLGNTARGLVAIFAGLVSASAIYLFLNRKGGSDMGVALREKINAASPIELDLDEEAKAKKSRFSLPKFDAKSLTKFLKKPKKDKARVMDLADLPQLRKVGEEADTDERPPIFAEAEAPSPLPEAIQPFEEAEQAEPVLADIPFTPDQTAAETAAPAIAEVAAEQPVPAPAPVAETPLEDLSDLNIAQLTDRLEAGLRRLKQLEAETFAAAPVPAQTVMTPPSIAPEQPAAAPQPAAGPISEEPTMTPPPLVEVEKSPEDIAAVRQADMDAALKAALGTLEKMTAQR